MVFPMTPTSPVSTAFTSGNTDKARQARATEAVEELKNNSSAYTDAEIKVLECMTQGLKRTEIGEKLGMAHSTVTSHLYKINCKKAGTLPPAVASGVNAKLERVKELHSQGKSPTEMSRITGYAVGMISKYHKDLGLEPFRKNGQAESKYGMSTTEAYRVINFTEANVIRRRIDRGMSVDEMAAADNCTRAFILHQMNKHGFEIPADEMWTRDSVSGTKMRWTPRNREVRRPSATDPAYNQSIVRTLPRGASWGDKS